MTDVEQEASAEATHFVELTIEGGELHRAFRCVAPEDASCRRRPKDLEGRESWPAEEATEPGFPCCATEWVADVGIEDAIHAYPDQVLASVPVTISYAEGVDITPVSSAPATREAVTAEQIDAATYALCDYDTDLSDRGNGSPTDAHWHERRADVIRVLAALGITERKDEDHEPDSSLDDCPACDASLDDCDPAGVCCEDCWHHANRSITEKGSE